LGCVQKCDLWACQRKEKKGQKLSCVKLAICPEHPRRRRPLKFCVRGRVREVVIYFKFHENRSRGLGAVEGRISPSPIDKAHGLYNSLYYRTSRDSTWICSSIVQQHEQSIPFPIPVPYATKSYDVFPKVPCVRAHCLNILKKLTSTIFKRFFVESIFNILF